MKIRPIEAEWGYKRTNVIGASHEQEYRDHIATIKSKCDCGHTWTARRGEPDKSGGIGRTIGHATLTCPRCGAEEQFTIDALPFVN